ncbi:MAG TPA: thiolase family protein [Candidatus Binataceae bacterium]|nr:thiolase family protein [Candidatus Binataceae bacterium]
MREVVIVDGVRTPIGRAGREHAYYKDVRGDELGVACVRRLLERNPAIDPAGIEDVIWGCANQSGEQSLNLGRMIALLAGLPVEVAGTTLDRQCGSSLQAVNFAAQAIMCGAGEIMIAGGVENMSHVAMGAGVNPNPRLLELYPPEMYVMGMTAERLAAMHGITRVQADAFALRSNLRAVAARDRFKDEIVPIKLPDGATAEVDQGPRAETTLEKLAGLKPSFTPEGQVTAGNSSQISDGAAAVIVMSGERARALGLKPRLRVRATAVAGVRPEIMGWGPVPATHKALKRAGLAAGEIDLWEINEAFAAQVLACNTELKIDEEILNVNGGAIAIGHPLGCSGARLVVTLMHEMARRGTALGVATMCIGIGQGIATVFEQV